MADISTEQLPIGQRVMRYRVRAGMSRAQLSGLIGKSPSWLYKVERGVLMPDRLSVLSELATVLRVDISELAGAPVPTALLSPAATVPRPVPATVVHEVEGAAPPASNGSVPEPAGVPAPPPAVVAVPPPSEEPAVVSAPPASEEPAPPPAVVAVPPATEEPAPPPAVVAVPPATEEPAVVSAPPFQEPPLPAPWRATTARERRWAVAAVVAAAAVVAVCMLLSGAGSGADSPRAQAAPPMTVFPAPPSDTSIPRPTAAPGSPAGSNLVADPPPGTGPQSAARPGPAAARPVGGTPAALRPRGAGAQTSTAAPAPSGTASQSPSTGNLAAWWPYASTASSGACSGSSSSGCNPGSGQAGRCSNVAYDGDTGVVPDSGIWRLTVRVGSGGVLCVHWNNAGIEGTLTGPDGRGRLVPGDTWMVLSGGPGRYTLQLRRIDPSRPDHAHLQMFG
jgi:transcriptional regulator with XRE-family HTH domain